VTAGIDLALVMIEEDFGKKMALDVAKYLIVYVRRAGGQSQFSPLLETQAAADLRSSRFSSTCSTIFICRTPWPRLRSG